jgi:ABC-2 type transport system permease protein
MSVYLLALLGIGLFIALVARTQREAVLGTFAFMVPMRLLSGFTSPIENMHDWRRYVTLANPVRHFMVIAKRLLLKAMPARDVFSSFWPLVSIAASTLTESTSLFRRRG